MTQPVAVNPPVSSARSLTLKRALIAGSLGGMYAAVGNVIVLLLAQGMLAIDMSVPMGPAGPLSPLSPVQVALVTILPGLAAGFILWLLGKFTARALPIFIGISTAFFLISFGGPYGMGGFPPNVNHVLAVMHIVAAVSIVGMLVREARKQG